MIHKQELERMKSILQENKQDYENEIMTLPAGSLYCSKRGGQWFYYQLLPVKGNRKKEKRIGITRDLDTVFGLVRKNFITKALPLIDKDIKVLEMAIKHYVCFDAESVMLKYLEKHPELCSGVSYGQRSDKEWAASFEKPVDFYEEERKHTSINGDKMLSKNELYIASRLDHHGIPYRYEVKIKNPDTNRIPDFTIKRPRDGKIIYWEHMGLTTDGGYMEGNELKFVEYENCGIVPWDNLIVTYDTADGGIDARIIEAMIIGWLL